MRRGDLIWLRSHATGEVFRGKVTHVMSLTKFTATRIGSAEFVTVGDWRHPMASIAPPPK